MKRERDFKDVLPLNTTSLPPRTHSTVHVGSSCVAFQAFENLLKIFAVFSSQGFVDFHIHVELPIAIY